MNDQQITTFTPEQLETIATALRAAFYHAPHCATCVDRALVMAILALRDDPAHRCTGEGLNPAMVDRIREGASEALRRLDPNDVFAGVPTSEQAEARRVADLEQMAPEIVRACRLGLTAEQLDRVRDVLGSPKA